MLSRASCLAIHNRADSVWSSPLTIPAYLSSCLHPLQSAVCSSTPTFAVLLMTTITAHIKLVSASQPAHLIAATALRRALPRVYLLRSLSTTPRNCLRDVFPAKDTPKIQTTPAAWPHHGYTYEEMKAVVPAHRAPESLADWVAWKVVRAARWGMDKATGMDKRQQVDKNHPTTAVLAEKPLTEAQWVGRQLLP